jgi:NAD(P)-dependent dehydrogenase (short-subunit alcohol dehydrogenase family)
VPPGEDEEHAAPVAVITGASRGIGAAVARLLAQRGQRCALVARTEPALRKTLADVEAAGSSGLVVAADLSDLAELDRAVQRIGDYFGRVDVLINNAGWLPAAQRIDKVSVADWQTALAINTTAPWYLSCRVKPLMPRGGVIVNVSSTAAHYPSVGLSPYNVSKAALNMLTRCCAVEWASSGIRVVGVVPGKTDTALAQPVLEYVSAHQLRANPMNRVGSPEEIAAVIGFLASPEASFTTGALYRVDGGELIRAGNDD